VNHLGPWTWPNIIALKHLALTPPPKGTVLPVVAAESKVKIGVFEIDFEHELTWANQVSDITDGLHFEMDLGRE
jgi:hypothetical protein